MKPLVVGWRKPEDSEQRPIAAAGVFKATMNQCRKIVPRQFVCLEGLVDHRPEALACDETFPQPVGRPRTAIDSTRRRGAAFLSKRDSRDRHARHVSAPTDLNW